MRLIKITGALAILLLAGSSLFAQKVWTLEDCIQHALENNIQIKQQLLGVEAARQNLMQSRGNLFPTLNASASHAYNFGRIIDPFTNEFVTEGIRTNNFNVSSGLTLFGGFQILNSIRQNSLELQANQYDVQGMKNDIALAVAAGYLQILFSMELAEIAANQLEITRQQIERTSRLVEAGTLARGSLLTMEAQGATEELQLVNAQNNLDIAYLNLMQLLDLETLEGFAIEVPEIQITPDSDYLYSPMQVYLRAVETQPQVRAAEVRVGSAELGVAIAAGSRSPVLRLSGSMGTGYSEASLERTGQVPGPLVPIGVTESGEVVYAPSFEYHRQVIPFKDQLDINLNRSLGLFLTIPIFNNFQVRGAVNRSKIFLDNVRLNNQLVRDQLFKTIQQSHADAIAALKRYQATLKNVGALEEAFHYTEQRFNVGMIPTLEYNDAKNRLVAAQSELMQSKYEYVFRVQILDFYLGNPISF